MEIDHDRLDPIRKESGPILEHIIDELPWRPDDVGVTSCGAPPCSACRSRWSAAPFCPRPGASECSIAARRSPSGRKDRDRFRRDINAGMIVPAAAVNPITIEDQGGLEILGNIGEYLVFSRPKLVYHPWLATSWTSNADASVWTFKIRQGVKFNNGKAMTVDDVVYSFKSQSSTKTGGNALSVFGGTLIPDGVVKVDDTTSPSTSRHRTRASSTPSPKTTTT